MKKQSPRRSRHRKSSKNGVGFFLVLAMIICLGIFALTAQKDKTEALPSGAPIPAGQGSVQKPFPDTNEGKQPPAASSGADSSSAASHADSIKEDSPSDSVPVLSEVPDAVEKQPDTPVLNPTVTVSGIRLTTYDITLSVGDGKMPIVTMLPEDASDKRESWSSDNKAVAAVNGYGKITAQGEGQCTVTVSSVQNPAVYAEVKVTVVPRTEPELTYIDGILIANKSYPLPSDYNPGVDSTAQSALDDMIAAAEEDGISLWVRSGFRSYSTQKSLYEGYVRQDGKAAADRYSARPGYSEHQTGLAFDLNSLSQSFANTPEGKWLAAHCHEYGFIIRYPDGKEDVTGYMYEPWHVRYLGKETAKAVYDSGKCLEEYLGITSIYAD